MPLPTRSTRRICPECGVDLAGRDGTAHALSHWPEYLDPVRDSRQARERQEICRAGGEEVEV